MSKLKAIFYYAPKVGVRAAAFKAMAVYENAIKDLRDFETSLDSIQESPPNRVVLTASDEKSAQRRSALQKSIDELRKEWKGGETLSD